MERRSPPYSADHWPNLRALLRYLARIAGVTEAFLRKSLLNLVLARRILACARLALFAWWDPSAACGPNPRLGQASRVASPVDSDGRRRWELLRREGGPSELPNCARSAAGAGAEASQPPARAGRP